MHRTMLPCTVCGRWPGPKLRRITEHLMHYRCACGTEAGCGATIRAARRRWNALMRRRVLRC
jgi:hypothetical protein